MMIANKIKISIIFPSYNGENVIFNNLRSIQNLKNSNEIELLIVDNNSIDSTVDIINSFKNSININLIEQKENLGFAKACNIAVIKAKGEFIFITNQDVAFPKDFFIILLNLYKKIEKDQEIIISPAVVFPGKYINYFGAKIHFLGMSYTPNMYKKIPKEKGYYKTLKAAGCSMFMKKKVFLKLNGFDPFFFMYHEDSDFSLKAVRNQITIYTTNEILLTHQKIHMSINNFTYYYIERNRYLVIYKNVDNLKSLIPYIIISELMLIFQALLSNKIITRFRIYKFLIQNYRKIKYLRTNKINCKNKKIQKIDLDRHLDPILLGRLLSNVKLMRYLLIIMNLIF